MPKYYIGDGEEQAVVDAEDPCDACVKALEMGLFSSAMINGYYLVSEQGLSEIHEGDLFICSNDVNEEYHFRKNG